MPLEHIQFVHEYRTKTREDLVYFAFLPFVLADRDDDGIAFFDFHIDNWLIHFLGQRRYLVKA